MTASRGHRVALALKRFGGLLPLLPHASIAAGLVLATIYLSGLLGELGYSGSSDLHFRIDKTLHNLAELRITMAKTGPSDVAEVVERFDVVYSRIALLAQGDAGLQLAGNRRARPLLLELLRLRDEGAQLIDGSGLSAADLLATLEPSVEAMEQAVQALLGLAVQEISEEDTRRRRQIAWLLRASLAGAAGAVLLLMGMAFFELRQRARLQQTSRELDVAARQAEAANRAKSDFLANVSHELRTPLNAILGLTGVLYGRARDPEDKEKLGLIRQSGNTLLELLNTILDGARIEAGKLEMKVEDFDLQRCVEDLMALWAPAFEAKGIGLEARFADDLRRGMRSDRAKLQQILNNLLSNACKFTEAGSVRVSVDQTWTADGLLATRFEVADSGPGIAPELQRRLFERFAQGESGDRRRHAGSGLGLSISRGLVEFLGSTLELQSTLGKGSRFSFTLTGPEVVLAAQAAEERPSAQLPRPGLRVLVAEDNWVNQEVIRALLAPLGLSLDLVPNGLEAVAAIARAPYDLVLMDVQMPEMDGITAAQRIRALEGPMARVPILALTANDSEEAFAEYQAAGFDACLGKPIDSRLLIDAIARLTDVAVAEERDASAA